MIFSIIVFVVFLILFVICKIASHLSKGWGYRFEDITGIIAGISAAVIILFSMLSVEMHLDLNRSEYTIKQRYENVLENTGDIKCAELAVSSDLIETNEQIIKLNRSKKNKLFSIYIFVPEFDLIKLNPWGYE